MRVIIVDFGMADAADMSRLTMSGVFLGTPAYASPEQALFQGATSASDVYAAGVMFYEMLSGQLPHDADSSEGRLRKIAVEPATPIRKYREDLPGAISGLLERMLEAEPAARPSAAEAAQLATPISV